MEATAIRYKSIRSKLRSLFIRDLETYLPIDMRSPYKYMANGIINEGEYIRAALSEFKRWGYNFKGGPIMKTCDDHFGGDLIHYRKYETSIPAWRYIRACAYWRLRKWLFTDKGKRFFGVITVSDIGCKDVYIQPSVRKGSEFVAMVEDAKARSADPPVTVK